MKSFFLLIIVDDGVLNGTDTLFSKHSIYFEFELA